MRRLHLLVGVLLFCGVAAPAATCTWVGGFGGNTWFNTNNWSGQAVPGNGDAVIVPSGKTVLLTNATASLASFSITNATLTFSNWTTRLTASNVTVQAGGILTLPVAHTNGVMSNRVWIVCTNLLVTEGGTIDTKGRGYRGGLGTSGWGCGPGRGTCISYYGGGGGHAGIAGNGTHGYGGLPYGVTNKPAFPGSGGGGSGSGAGGGAIWLEVASTATVHGVIRADGNASSAEGGGGSGGSVYLKCGVLAGSGTGKISADGGNGGSSGGGAAGGRVAIAYDPARQTLRAPPGIRFSVKRGTGYEAGEPGTLYLPDDTLFRELVTEFEYVRLYGVTNWQRASLTFSNVVVMFAQGRVKATNAVRVIGNADLHIGYTTTNCAGAFAELVCGSLVLTNGGDLYVYSAPTNTAPTNYGARVTVTGAMTVSSNSWVYPTSHGWYGGAVKFLLGSLRVFPWGGFDADGRGHRGGYGTSGWGYGPGRGTCSSYYGGGGGHGGKGGNGSHGAGGGVYDRTNAPTLPGSGGGGLGSGSGGGVIWVESPGTVVMHGTMTANGVACASNGGGGAGGSLWLSGRRFTGGAGARLRADAGRASASYTGGGGGGGCVAVWIGVTPEHREAYLAGQRVQTMVIKPAYEKFLGTLSATNGLGGYSPGEPGTAFFVEDEKPTGSVLQVR